MTTLFYLFVIVGIAAAMVVQVSSKLQNKNVIFKKKNVILTQDHCPLVWRCQSDC